MGTITHIQWTDHTFNPWEGCTKVSPGCAHCYAEARDIRFTGGKHWGKGAPRRRTSVHNWNEPRRWDRAAAEAYNEYESHKALHGGHAHYSEPRNPRVFCASLADWLDDEVPIEWLADLLALIKECDFLDWQLLTKRPELWRDRLAAVLEWCRCGPLTKYGLLAPWLNDWLNGTPPANVWIGTTAEDQARADERIPLLLEIPAKVRFLSCEPLLEEIDIQHFMRGILPDGPVQWVICGGESGPGARPMHPAWARSLRDQCQEAGVPFFFKQWGEHDQRTIRMGKILAGRQLDGIEHNAFPS